MDYWAPRCVCFNPVSIESCKDWNKKCTSYTPCMTHRKRVSVACDQARTQTVKPCKVTTVTSMQTNNTTVHDKPNTANSRYTQPSVQNCGVLEKASNSMQLRGPRASQITNSTQQQCVAVYAELMYMHNAYIAQRIRLHTHTTTKSSMIQVYKINASCWRRAQR